MQMLTPAKGQSHAQDRSADIYDVRLKGAGGGPAELFMVPHVGCPVAARPSVRVLEADSSSAT